MFSQWKKRREEAAMGRHLGSSRAGYPAPLPDAGEGPGYWGQVARILAFDAVVLAALAYGALHYAPGLI